MVAWQSDGPLISRSLAPIPSDCLVGQQRTHGILRDCLKTEEAVQVGEQARRAGMSTLASLAENTANSAAVDPEHSSGC